MRLMFLRGTFSVDGKDVQKGLICLCHLDAGDRRDHIIDSALVKIRRRRKINEPILLAPFCGFDEKTQIRETKYVRLAFSKLSALVVDVKVLQFNANANFQITTFVGFNEI